MRHWHVGFTNSNNAIINAVTYENSMQSVADYVDMAYEIYRDAYFLEEEDKPDYIINMLSLSDEEEPRKIFLLSKKINMFWAGCDNDPCSFAAYN